MRVTNLEGVDLNTYRFNYDLTFAALLMNADGTIYHTYAGRDAHDASSHQSEASFIRALEAGLKTHAAHKPRPVKKRRKLSIEMLPRWRESKKLDCYHCHQVYEGRQPGLSGRAAITRWPDPIQIGLRVDRDDQQLVSEVVPGSPAAKAGLRAGARLEGTATFGDLQRALDEARGKTLRLGDTTIKLPKGWRDPDPLVFAWRGTKWTVAPRPGFGGPNLNAEQKKRLGLAPDAFAFRVNYIVTWGINRRRGQNAARHGIRKNQIVIGVNGKRDFENEQHFQSWFSLTLKVGQKIKIEIIDRGKRRTLDFKTVD